MPSKGKKQRKTIDAGKNEANSLLNNASNAFSPFSAAGAPAVNQLLSFSGLLGPEAAAQAQSAFDNSAFRTIGETNFGLEKDAIDAGLSNSGLLFSSARQNAVEEARRRTAQNAFSSFLNNTSGLANIGFGGAQGQAGVLGQQSQNAFNAALAKAGTFKGLTQKLTDAVSAAGSIGKLAGSASNFFNPSDRRLKADVIEIDSFGPLPVYQWRWNERAKEDFGLVGDQIGFMADDVEKLMPEAIGVALGYKTVNYPAVMARFSQ